MITFDPAKSERNRETRGLPFHLVEELDWSSAIFGVCATQNADTATRFFAIGRIDQLLHTIIFTFEQNGIRVVSLRRASRKERKAWLASLTRT